jgi:mannonate dehydratase
MAAYGAAAGEAKFQGLHDGRIFEPAYYVRATLKMLEACRKELGEEVELVHDVHERVTPNLAVQLAKEVEPLRLFFLEDVLSAEDIAYFRLIRQQCATPLAMGELFNSPHEWAPLISERLIAFGNCIRPTSAVCFGPPLSC